MNTIRHAIAALFRRLNAALEAYIDRRVNDINRIRGRLDDAHDNATDVFLIGPEDAEDFPDRVVVFGLMCLIRELSIDDFNTLIAKELTP